MTMYEMTIGDLVGSTGTTVKGTLDVTSAAPQHLWWNPLSFTGSVVGQVGSTAMIDEANTTSAATATSDYRPFDPEQTRKWSKVLIVVTLMLFVQIATSVALTFAWVMIQDEDFAGAVAPLGVGAAGLVGIIGLLIKYGPKFGRN